MTPESPLCTQTQEEPLCLSWLPGVRRVSIRAVWGTGWRPGQAGAGGTRGATHGGQDSRWPRGPGWSPRGPANLTALLASGTSCCSSRAQQVPFLAGKSANIVCGLTWGPILRAVILSRLPVSVSGAAGLRVRAQSASPLVEFLGHISGSSPCMSDKEPPCRNETPHHARP